MKVPQDISCHQRRMLALVGVTLIFALGLYGLPTFIDGHGSPAPVQRSIPPRSCQEGTTTSTSINKCSHLMQDIQGFAATPSLLAFGALAVLAVHGSRTMSRTTSFGKHDQKTFRGKHHVCACKSSMVPELIEAGTVDHVAAALAGAKISASAVKELRGRSGAGILDCQKALKETDGDLDKAMEFLRKKGIAKADKKVGNAAAEGAIASYVHHNRRIAVIVEVNCETDFVAKTDKFKEFAADCAMQIAANPNIICITTDDVPADVMEKDKALEMEKDDLAGKPDDIKEKIVMGRLKKKYSEMALMEQPWLKDDDKDVATILKERISKLGENVVIRRFSRLSLGEGLEKQDADFAAGVEKELAKYKADPEAKPPVEEKPKPAETPKAEEPKDDKPKVKVSAAAVKELRQRSGGGMLDTKKALMECNNDMEAAMEWLKKRGLAKADKKAGNATVEGSVASYTHFNGKLGVIVEVNCETDFVAKGDIFSEFASDVAMQIAANPAVVSISLDDVPKEMMEKEKEIEMAKPDLDGKPDNIKEKIVDGRLKKRFAECALLEQVWLKDEEKTVNDVLKEKIAKLGENINIRRFERLNLGEGIEKEEKDFAAEVEAQLA